MNVGHREFDSKEYEDSMFEELHGKRNPKNDKLRIGIYVDKHVSARTTITVGSNLSDEEIKTIVLCEMKKLENEFKRDNSSWRYQDE